MDEIKQFLKRYADLESVEGAEYLAKNIHDLANNESINTVNDMADEFFKLVYDYIIALVMNKQN